MEIYPRNCQDTVIIKYTSKGENALRDYFGNLWKHTHRYEPAVPIAFIIVQLRIIHKDLMRFKNMTIKITQTSTMGLGLPHVP